MLSAKLLQAENWIRNSMNTRHSSQQEDKAVLSILKKCMTHRAVQQRGEAPVSAAGTGARCCWRRSWARRAPCRQSQRRAHTLPRQTLLQRRSAEATACPLSSCAGGLQGPSCQETHEDVHNTLSYCSCWVGFHVSR